MTKIRHFEDMSLTAIIDHESREIIIRQHDLYNGTGKLEFEQLETQLIDSINKRLDQNERKQKQD